MSSPTANDSPVPDGADPAQGQWRFNVRRGSGYWPRLWLRSEYGAPVVHDRPGGHTVESSRRLRVQPVVFSGLDYYELPDGTWLMSRHDGGDEMQQPQWQPRPRTWRDVFADAARPFLRRHQLTSATPTDCSLFGAGSEEVHRTFQVWPERRWMP
jgi:hypothetical protein